ncbi:hypothetical protein ZIOFF_046630 [Zingiber officinale]|uniref:Uncharacterized protein n=2 Tax=Zingiber officinale TaxID=94328 RepID=A0A8J5FQ91_ZINOF|nr:hypothetical protein ZIOFF_046630 [Zingiber officinale]
MIYVGPNLHRKSYGPLCFSVKRFSSLGRLDGRLTRFLSCSPKLSVRARVAMGDEDESPVLPPPGFPLNLNSMRIPQLVEFLRSSCQKVDFQEVQSALMSREASLKAEVEKRFLEELTAMEVEKVELGVRNEGLERDLGGLRNMLAELEQQQKKSEESFRFDRSDLQQKLRDKEARCSLLESRILDLEEIDRRHRIDFEYLEEEILALREACRVAREREQKSQKKIATLLVLQEHGNVDCWRRKCKELQDTVSQLEAEKLGRRVMKSNKSEEKGKSKASLPTKDKENPKFLGLIVISDNDDERRAEDCEVKKHSAERTLDMKNDSTLCKNPEMLHSDASRRVMGVQDFDENHPDGVLLIPTPKRKRVSRVFTSDSEKDDDADNIPIGKLWSMQAKEDYKPKRLISLRKLSETDDSMKGKFPTNPSTPRFEDSSLRSNGRAKVFLTNPSTPSFKRTSLRSKGRAREFPTNPSTPSFNSSSLRGNSRARRKLEFLGSDDEEETKIELRKELDDDASPNSEGKNLGGFIVSGSESAESAPSSEEFSSEIESGSVIDFGNILAEISRKKRTESWEYEADMLASFSRDSELCLKAVCVLYRQQTSDEQSAKGTFLLNKRGFNKLDAQRGSMVAEFLTDGDPNGPLKKTVQDLEKYDPTALSFCRKLASRYSKQLFTIYQSKEDPLFLPS